MNIFGWFMLLIWPAVSAGFFKRLPLTMALCMTLVGGYLLLPNAELIDLPLLPTLSKDTIPALSALVLVLVYLRQPQAAGSPQVLPGWLPKDPVIRILLMVVVIGAFGTYLTNQNPLRFGPLTLSALQPYDAFSILLNVAVALIPLALGRKILCTPEAQRTLCVCVGAAMAIYCLPALYEVRMSPQIHTMVYGFFPSQFAQAMRNGGFRPLVFLNHGLPLAIFLTIAMLAVAGLYRTASNEKRPYWLGALALMAGTLLLTKTLGALIIAVLLLPAALFLTPRRQSLIAAGVACLVMLYPMLRAADVVPLDRVLSVAERIDPDRARSLQIRIKNEDLFLERARMKPLFGWGGHGRNRIFDERGRNVAVSDGVWVLQFGVGGWFRYIGIFGLSCWPLVALALGRRDRLDTFSAILALMLAARLIDFLPNSGATLAVHWLVVGALIGRMEYVTKGVEEAPSVAEPDLDQRSRRQVYARDWGGDRAPASRYARAHSAAAPALESPRSAPRDEPRQTRKHRFARDNPNKTSEPKR